VKLNLLRFAGETTGSIWCGVEDLCRRMGWPKSIAEPFWMLHCRIEFHVMKLLCPDEEFFFNWKTGSTYTIIR
jgi:hypothetical protein